jgi:hypothetical protein
MDYVSKTGRCLPVACLIWLAVCCADLRGQATLSGFQKVTLGWTASSDPAVTGYYFYYGTTSGVYTNKTDAGTNTAFTVNGLVPGTTYYFSATSHNASGMESGYVVPEVSYVVPGIPGMLLLTQDPASAAMRVRFPVAPTCAYRLQASSDLKTWSTVWLTPTQTTNGWLEYNEPCNKSFRARFYRLATLPDIPENLTLTQDPARATMRVQFQVSPTYSYQLQASSDLKSWSNLWLTPTQTTNGTLEYDEPCTNTFRARFYRLVLY